MAVGRMGARGGFGFGGALGRPPVAATVRRMVGTLNDFSNTQRPSNGTNDSWNTVRCCYAKYDIVNPSAVYVGWTSGNTEADMPNGYTVKTALFSYDLATQFGEFTKSGGTSQVVAAGDAFNESDQLAITIPAGTFFKIVTYGFVTTGQLYYATDYGRNNTIGARAEQGVGLADKHLSPSTISNAVANNLFCPPVCLMGSVPSSRRAIVMPGDSLSVGVGNYLNGFIGTAGASAGGGFGYMAGHLDGKADYLHMGRSGYAMATAKTSMTRRNAFMLACNATDAWSNLGVNDLFAGNKSAATFLADAAIVYPLWKAKGIQRIYQSTLTPETNVVGPPSSDVNQNILSGVPANGADGRRQTANVTIRALGIAGLDGYAEVALTAENTSIPNDFFWKALYTTDGIHPIQAGGAAIVTALNSANPLGL